MGGDGDVFDFAVRNQRVLFVSLGAALSVAIMWLAVRTGRLDRAIDVVHPNLQPSDLTDSLLSGKPMVVVTLIRRVFLAAPMMPFTIAAIATLFGGAVLAWLMPLASPGR